MRHKLLKAPAHNRGPGFLRRILEHQGSTERGLPLPCLCFTIIHEENGLPDSGPVMENKSHIILAHEIDIKSIGRTAYRDFSIPLNIEDNEGDPLCIGLAQASQLRKEKGKLPVFLFLRIRL